MENKKITLDLLLNNMSVFNMLYDVIRVVDPIKKQILDVNSGKINALNSSCYSLWKKNQVCKNCVSVRAYRENESFVKIEYDGEKVYMLTALPFELEHGRIVLELLKDVTNSGLIENIDNKNSDTIHDLVNNMNNLIVIDPLTEVFNKRFLNERLPVDMTYSLKNEEPLSIIMVDIDHFKKVNDNYGHVSGDKVLKAIAKTLSYRIRKDIDWVARYGGEEFLVCLKNADKDLAVKIAERMREAIETLKINIGYDTINVTASFGVETMINNALTMELFLSNADEKLYTAKKHGRNRVIA